VILVQLEDGFGTIMKGPRPVIFVPEVMAIYTTVAIVARKHLMMIRTLCYLINICYQTLAIQVFLSITLSFKVTWKEAAE
jgi:hypothetical protein